MGTGKKSHGKKTDQETQSPMLKIFKDIIQRDTDPEKTNLLKDNNEDRKKRHYSSSKPKIGHKSESSSSERSRKTVSHKSHETRNLEYDPCRPRSAPFQGDRKESWWFWGEKNSNRDTRSCVSCALKKLGGSEYFCVGCLLLIFAVSVVVAFLLVFRSVPTIAADMPSSSGGGMLDSDMLRRKMDALNEKKAKKDLKADREKREWDNTAWKHLDGQGSLTRTDFGRSGLNDMVSIEGNEKSELSNILDAEKIDEFKSNDRLKDFFKKLAQTDAQIRLLKKGMADPSLPTSESEKTLKNILERSKRSIDVNHTKLSNKKKPGSISRDKFFRKNSRHRPFYILKREKPKDMRNKRFANDTEPTGLFIEKKKVFVQYLPADTKKIPKCSHSSKDSKSHEILLKHPFYKNTQRLDEMLDQFIAKNLNDIIDDPYALDLLMKKKKEKCKHPATNEETLKTEKQHAKEKLNDIKSGEQKISDEEIRKLLQPLVTTKLLENEAKKLAISRPKDKSGITTSTQDYDLILSISTVLNLGADLATTPSSFGRGHIFRKLMQVDEDDDENIGYEDLKEVLTEDLEAHDERDSHGHRKKREDPNQLSQILNFPSPPGVNNPNWKGAMPLYPDEINSMIKQAALNANKFVLMKNKDGKEFFPSKAVTETKDANDVQYIEEYFDSKFNRLVNMAQAYSDYGVLDGKRNGVGTEKAGGDKILEHRVKLSANEDMLFGRLKQGTPTSEGIRFELRPTTSSREDKPLGVSKLLYKHLRISPERSDQPRAQALGNALPANSEIDFMFSPTKYDKQFEYSAKTKPFKNYDSEGGIGFNIHRNRRSLKSISDEDLNEVNEEKLVNDGKDFDIINEGLTGVILLEHLNANNISPWHNAGIKTLKSKEEYKLNGYKNEDSNNHSATYTNATNTYFTVKIMRRMKRNNTKQKSAKNSSHNATLKMEPNLINLTLDPDKVLVKNQSEKDNKSIHGDISNNNEKKSSISDFFMMLTNFFSFLEDFGLALKLNTSLNSHFTPNKSKNNNISYINISTHLHPPNNSNVTKIGFRSRALLSVNDSMKIDDVQNEATATEISTEATEHSNIANTMNLTQIKDASNSTTLKAVDYKANTAAPKNKGLKNKTVVKRNADDSNLIFWNDIYDDEYGIRAEPVENVRDKHSVPKTPSTWFKDKLRRLTDNLRKKPDKRTGKRSAPDKSGFRKPLNRKETSFRRLNKRDLKLVETDEFQPDRSLAALNANMKEVCRKAARAVQQTKNLEVKEDTKESAAATSLMQQLVKLMTDLVDYQVQQRTCLQLPPDLQSFLEWLTGSGQEGASDLSYKSSFQEDFVTELEPNSNDEKPSDHYLSMEMITPTTSEREEVHPEERSDCLGTLRAVQDLILQYDELSEEEKSKMVGIKEYLDNQLDYLEKYIVLVDDLNVNQKRDFPLRFKRNTFRRKVHNEKRNKTHEEIKQRMKNILKFKNKKYTKTTPHSFAKTTKVSHQEPKKSKVKTYVRPTFEPKILNPSKRNLKDVYFKAVADAKKATTIKNNEEYSN